MRQRREDFPHDALQAIDGNESAAEPSGDPAAADGTDTYERRESPRGLVYYWPVGDGMEFTHTAPELKFD